MKKKDFFEIRPQEFSNNMSNILENQIFDVADTIQTVKGTVYFNGPLNRDQLESLTIDSNLNNFRPARAQYEAILGISEMEGAMIFTACHAGTIIGYIAFHKPEFPRWAKAAESELPELLELGGIEVSDNWWGHGVGKAMLEWTFGNYDFEEKIVISMETCYNWKSRDPSVSIWEYREMLKNVLGHVGFIPKATDDPEILEHPANMLTVRTGSRVSGEAKNKFERLLKLTKHQKEFH